jgi:outer membrane protein TolC
MNKRVFVIIVILKLAFIAKTYTQDSIKTLNAEQLLQLVKLYHPVAKQASINIEKSKADIQIARGAFDPIISNYIARKTFDGTNYYTYTAPAIVAPTWYGIEIYSGLEDLGGARLDPNQTSGKTSYFGVSIPLAKNLVLDKRRAFLQQAKIYNTMAIVEQQAILNDLLMDAINNYWLWVKAFQKYVITKNSVIVNEKRLEFVKKMFQYGERPAIDTVETLAQLQSFQFMQSQYWLEFQNAGLQLSAYLWKNNDEPYTLPETIIPQDGWENETNISKFNIALQDLLQVAESNHPDLRLYNYKLDILTIDKKLKYQDLLPKLDFQYNQLGKGYNLLKTTTTGPFFENNFQYGLKFEMPLLLRKGRGEYTKAKLKIQETKLDQNQKQVQILLKVKTYYNEFVTLKNQITLQSSNLNNYNRLVRAEEIRFENGESSLFLINVRETKALEALEKLIELKTKYYKTIYTLQWSAGLLY